MSAPKRPRRPSRHRGSSAEPARAYEDSPAPPATKDVRGADNQRRDAGGKRRGGRVLQALWSGTQLASGVLIVICASVAVAWGAHHYALTTPRFAIKQIQVEGNRRLTDAQVAKVAGIEAGTNTFALDLENAQRKLLEQPWISSGKITRELPGALRIELSEREAAALAAIDGRLYLVTPEGEPFKQLESGDPYDLPVVTGVDVQNLQRDRKREIERLGVALQVLRHYERVRMSAAYPAQEVHLTAGGSMVLTVGKDGISLHLGKGPWKKKLLMAERVTQQLGRKGRVPGIVFLDNQARPERVVVRMR